MVLPIDYDSGPNPDTETQLSAIRASFISDSIESRGNQAPLTPEQVRELDQVFRVGGGQKVIFGATIEEWVSRGFLISKDMYRVTTFGPVAVAAAEGLRHVLEFCVIPCRGDVYRGIEGCTGTGSQTWALAQQGLAIDATVEQDPVVALYTRTNLQKFQLEELRGLTIAVMDVRSYFAAQLTANNGGGRQHDWVMLDPDWLGKHYLEEGDFTFDGMVPDGEGLIGQALQLAAVVGIKAPENLSDNEIIRVAENVGAHAMVLDVRLMVGEERIQERIVYFVADDVVPFAEGDRIFEMAEAEVYF